MPRTEEQKRSIEPLSVRFGKQDYQVQILRAKQSRAWRKKLVKQLDTILDNFEITTDDPKVLSGGLMSALVHFPEKLRNLVFAYAADLDQKKILEEASDEQIGTAFFMIMEVGFPFATALGLAMQIRQGERRAS